MSTVIFIPGSRFASPLATGRTVCRARRLVCRFALFCLTILLTVAVPAIDHADEREFDERFLEGLRQRRLFELAETHCRLKWETPKLSAVERGHLAVQWIQTLAEHARHSLVEPRRALVRQAHEVAADFGRRHPDASIRILVRSQEAMADVMAGELTRLEAEVEASAPSVEAARKTSRDAARALEQLDQELTQLLPQVFRRPPGADDLSAQQLATLQHQLRLSGARALRNLGQCYPADSDDRLATLQRAIALLDKSLDQLPPDAPLVSPLRIESATAYRLLGKLDLARQSLAALNSDSATPAQQLAVRAEAVRILLAAGRVDEAAQLAARQREIAGATSADLDFARLEALVARWRVAAGKKTETGGLQNEVEATLREIESYHGAYWKHRGELLLVRASLGAAPGGGTGAANLDLLGRTADSLYVQGRVDDALAAYDQAAAKASGDGQLESAFSLRYKAAMVQQRRQRHDDAAERLHDLAVSAKSNARASEAHLLAAWNLAQQLRKVDGESQATLSSRYVEWLHEHMSTWPHAVTVAQARLWLGTWLASQAKWRDATAALRDVARESPHFDAALAVIARTAREDLAERRRQATPELAAAVDDYAQWFEQIVLDAAGQPVENWTARHWLAALAAAAVQLDALHDSPPAGRSASELRTVRAARSALLIRTALGRVRVPDVVTHADACDARRLLVRALAAQPGQEANAIEQVHELTRESASEPASVEAASREPKSSVEWLKLAEQIGAERTDHDAARRKQLAAVILAVVEQIDEGVLGPHERSRSAALRAAALAGSGQRTAALQAFRDLSVAQPKDAAIQEQYALLLAAGEARTDWEAALVQWRKIAARSEPRSDRWFRAKLAVATLQAQLGRTTEAAQLIRFLQATPPGLEETPLKSQFESLLKRCESKGGERRGTSTGAKSGPKTSPDAGSDRAK